VTGGSKKARRRRSVNLHDWDLTAIFLTNKKQHVKEPKTLLVESTTDMWKSKGLSPDGKYRRSEEPRTSSWCKVQTCRTANEELLVKVQTSYNTDAHSS
jgi:hypothetical protein